MFATPNGECVLSQLKTESSIWLVSVPQEAIDLLITEHSKHPDSPYLFPSPITWGMYYPDSVVNIHKKILEDVGLRKQQEKRNCKGVRKGALSKREEKELSYLINLLGFLHGKDQTYKFFCRMRDSNIIVFSFGTFLCKIGSKSRIPKAIVSRCGIDYEPKIARTALFHANMAAYVLARLVNRR